MTIERLFAVAARRQAMIHEWEAEVRHDTHLPATTEMTARRRGHGRPHGHASVDRLLSLCAHPAAVGVRIVRLPQPGQSDEVRIYINGDIVARALDEAVARRSG